MKKRILTIVMAVIMAAAVLPVSFAAGNLTTPVGMDISSMSTTDTKGFMVEGDIFSKYQLTVLNYWAVWCGPCVNEMPHFQKLYENYLDLGVNMLGVLIEDAASTLAGGNNLINNKGLTYTSLRMVSDTALRNLYNKGVSEANGIPMSFLIDNNGVVLSAKVGSFNTYNELETWVLDYWQNPTLQSVTIPETAEVGVNRMLSLNAALDPSYAFVDSMTWMSSDKGVVKVSANGILTGVSVGTATVSVTVVSRDVTITASCEVTVTESEAITDDTLVYARANEVKDGAEYAVVTNYQGDWYVMLPTMAVDGRYRLAGAKLDPENMAVISNENGSTDTVFIDLDDLYLWRFTAEDEGYAVQNISAETYLSTVRANGIYRTNLKSKFDVAWDYENGYLAAVTSGRYSSDRQFMSYYADSDYNFAPAFDILNADSDVFNNVMIFTKMTAGEAAENITDEPEAEPVPGDLNGDDRLDAGDATLLLRAIVGEFELTEEQIKICDLNENGRADSGDVGLILHMIVEE